jgi:hypothetical protein
MTLFYGWIIVGVGIVVTSAGFGAMFSLGVFVQPMSEAMGWSRTAISTAALLNFLGAVAIASTFRPPRGLPVAVTAPSEAH